MSLERFIYLSVASLRMQEKDWVISLFVFAALFVFTTPLEASHLTGRSTHDDNQTNETHLECVNQACVLVNNTVNGTNVDLCKTTTDCINETINRTDYVRAVRANRTVEINLTHMECINQACVVVNGTGVNQCTSSLECSNETNLTHLECVNQACAPVNNTVNGTNMDLCRSNNDCQNQSNMTGNGDGYIPPLPLAPPAEPPAAEQPSESRTLAGIIFSMFRAITGFFGIS